MRCGLDQLTAGTRGALRRRLRDARVGLLTHAAAVDRRGRSAIAVLDELGAAPSLVFAPEHGLDGLAQAEEAVADPEQDEAGPRVVSLYGRARDSLTPKPEDLAQLDVLVVDLVDVGSRYYTYVWTALLALRAAAAAGVHTVVLDRPNPIAGDPATLEGAPQRQDYCSFVGLEPLPIRHALTVGELLALFLERDGRPLGPDGALSIVPCIGWERQRTAAAWHRPFSPPSPNMPTVETALVYPGSCLLEGTNLSEGRGTTLPFQLVGAPFLNGELLCRELGARGLPGFQVRPARFRPTFEKHAGSICSGVLLQVTDPITFKPVSTYATLIALARSLAPEQFVFLDRPYEFETEKPAFDLLTGGPDARALLERGGSPEELVELLQPVPSEWRDEVLRAEARVLAAQA